MKGLQLFSAIKYESSIKHIIIYCFKGIKNKHKKYFTNNLTISQQQNFFLYSLYKNPNINISFTDQSLFRDQNNFKKIITGNNIQNTINITKLKFQIFQSSVEQPHSKLISISEYDLFLSRLRQKQLDNVFSNRIVEKVMINMQIKVRRLAYNILFNNTFFVKKTITETRITVEHSRIGIINVRSRSKNPNLIDSGLYYEIKQFKEIKGELKGLQNKNQN
ncbi:hypothetical protein ABPG72_017589 [Tetrahymena utriculariae]